MKTFSNYLCEAFRGSGYILNGLDYDKLSKENLTSILNAIRENKKKYISDAISLKPLLDSIPMKFSSPTQISKLQPLRDALIKLSPSMNFSSGLYNRGYKDDSKIFNNAVYYDGYFSRGDLYSRSDSCETIVNATNDKWKFFFAKCYGMGMKTDEIVELKNLIVTICKEYMEFPKEYYLGMKIPKSEDIVQAIFKGSGYISKKSSIYPNLFFREAQNAKKLYVDDPKKEKYTILYGADIYFDMGWFSKYYVKPNTFHDVATTDNGISYAFTGVYKAVIDDSTGIPESVNYGMLIRKASVPKNRNYIYCKLNPAGNDIRGGITEASPDELKSVFNLSGKFVPYPDSLYQKIKAEIDPAYAKNLSTTRR